MESELSASYARCPPSSLSREAASSPFILKLIVGRPASVWCLPWFFSRDEVVVHLASTSISLSQALCNGGPLRLA